MRLSVCLSKSQRSDTAALRSPTMTSLRRIPTRFAAAIGPIPARMSFQYSSSRLRFLLGSRLAIFTVEILVKYCCET